MPVPLLVSPANNKTNVALRSRLSWTLSPFDGDARNYSYNVRITNNNTQVILLDTVVNNVAFIDPTFESGKTYSWKVRVTQNGSFGLWSGEFLLNTINYCEANSLICAEYTQHISSVQFAGLENLNTVCSVTDDGYSDYSTMYASVTVGTSRLLTVTVTSGLNNDKCGAWFDWNQNGSFVDPGEFYQMYSDDGITYTANILVPENALTGFNRMRLRVVSNEDVLSPLRFVKCRRNGRLFDRCFTGNAIDYS